MIPVTTFLEMKVHSEHFWGFPEVWGLKLDQVVTAHIILHERQSRKGSNVVTARQYSTNVVRVIIRLRVDRRFVLPNCYNMSRVYQTEQVVELPLIVHAKW